MSAELYHNRVLELAANIPNVGRLEDADASVEKVSRVCGSVVRVDIRLSEDGETVEAVAVHIAGAPVKDVFAARDALRAMLKDGAEPPTGRFAELRHLAGVADYPPRHTSTMLAFEAACEAIEQVRTKRAAAA